MPSRPNQPGTHAAHGINNPQKFFVQKQSSPFHPVVSEEDGDWWSGVQYCAANIALSAALLVSSTTFIASKVVSQPQDEVPTPPTAIGSSGSFPVSLPFSNVQIRYTFPDDEFPQPGAVTTPANEDYWQNPSPPWPLSPPQVFQSDDQTPTLYGQYDEDFWINPVAPVPLLFGPLYIPDPEEIPAAQLHGQYDEDFWNNPVAPVPLTLGPLYIPDPEEIPAAQLYGQQDEFFWSPPFPWPLQSSQPFKDDEIIVPQPTGFQPDEDFWTQFVPAQSPYAYLQQWTFDEQTPLLFPQPDEDFWFNPVAPVPFTLQWPQPWFFDEQSPILYGQYDEDFWQNPVAPVPATLIYFQQWVFDEQTPALFPQPDEDFWVNPVAPIPYTLLYPQQWTFDEQFPALFGQPDEDFWTPQIPPQQWATSFQVFAFDDVIVPQPAPLGIDEDFWQNFVAPVWFSFLALYLPDPENVAPTIPFVPGVAFNRVELGWGGDVAADNVTLGGFG